eukprot:9471984-Pyramimonas_sp.AAC.1
MATPRSKRFDVAFQGPCILIIAHPSHTGWPVASPSPWRHTPRTLRAPHRELHRRPQGWAGGRAQRHPAHTL